MTTTPQKRPGFPKLAAFVPTAEQRARVVDLASQTPHLTGDKIAQMLGVPRATFNRHFREELAEGRAKRDVPERRGAPPGGFGNPGFVVTDSARQMARTLAQTFPDHNEKYIAGQMGISVDTLRHHFSQEMLLGRAELIARAGAQLISKALRGEDARGPDGNLLAPGNLDALKFLLARRGGWTTKVDLSGMLRRSTPEIDLSNLNDEELEQYGQLCLAATGGKMDDEAETDAG